MADWLPIDSLENSVVESLQAGRRLILQAPTGSGKSTRVPQMLVRRGLAGSGQVVVLQPRRIAARLLASFVAGEVGSRLGDRVGYQVRFENCCSAATRIRYVTEGVLLRQMLDDPALTGVSAIIFDEFHERHLYGDITLGQALTVQEEQRPDLNIIVMSATLDSAGLAAYLDPCEVLASAGRTFPVEIEYWPHRVGVNGPPVWDLAAEAFRRARRAGAMGDVLVFMPGGYEIQQTISAISNCEEARGHLVLPLHGELAPEEQDAAVRRYSQPKVIVATNVAETSVTIDGVRVVIDSGLARIPRYDVQRGLNTLFIEKISQASSDQRAGRAGRTAPGRCIRLWTEKEHWERPEQELPEVRRLDLAEVVLTLKACEVVDLRRFRWLEMPEAGALEHAEELLCDLGAVRDDGHITAMGQRMLAFPVHPRYSRMLLAAAERGCVRQASLVAALTQGRDLLLRKVPPEVARLREDLWGGEGSSDFWNLMRAWSYASRNSYRVDACRRLGIHALTARQVTSLNEQFIRIARAEGLPVEEQPENDDALRQCILVAFSDRVARRVDSGTLRCDLVHGRKGTLTRESVVQRASLLVAAEIREVETSDQATNTLLSLATAIEVAWLRELFPGDLREVVRVEYEPVSRRVLAEVQLRFRDLAIQSRATQPPAAEAARLLAGEVESGRLSIGGWDHGLDQWILRLNLLARWCPELGLPEIDREARRHLIEQVCYGSYSARDLKDADAQESVRSWLSKEQAALLEQHAPERVRLANGRTPKVTYEMENPPYIGLRIQELYGVETLPSIGLGRMALVVHILAPNMRPVQITKDLKGFWREQYPRVRQELQRKYPKHEWR
jgi:ATP-dependent helicase HrpB